MAQVPDIETLQQAVVSFRDQRDWKQFHDPKDVAISLSLEASELLELFQWKTSEQALKNKDAIRQELADILYWVLLLGHDLNINLASALKSKLDANAKKYPVEKSRGSAKKYTELG